MDEQSEEQLPAAARGGVYPPSTARNPLASYCTKPAISRRQLALQASGRLNKLNIVKSSDKLYETTDLLIILVSAHLVAASFNKKLLIIVSIGVIMLALLFLFKH